MVRLFVYALGVVASAVFGALILCFGILLNVLINGTVGFMFGFIAANILPFIGEAMVSGANAIGMVNMTTSNLPAFFCFVGVISPFIKTTVNK